jgi:Kdo2-lipid IVA lauroyltransferase/acyltransferase
MFVALVRRLPYKIALKLGKGMGTLAHRLLSRRRALTQRNLAFVFPDIESVEIGRLSKVVFQNIGKTLIESVYTAKWTKEQLLAQVEVQGREHFEKALARGRGILLLSAHYGNWEMMPMAINSLGYKLKVIARRMDNPRLDRLVNGIRARFGTEVVAGANSMKEMVRCLRRNEALGILMDLNQYENGVFADLFHKPAATTPIVPLLAKRTGAAILPIHVFRLNDGRHRIIIENELMLADIGDHRQFLEVNTRLCNQAVEKWILDNPAEWFWVHDRWKTRPPQ